MTTPLADVHSADPLLVLSHLRWGEHWQRPQQLVARLARHREVLFVEPPRYLDDVARPHMAFAVPYPGVHRVITRLPTAYRENDAVAHVIVRTLLMELLGPYGALAHRFDAPILWFSTPMPAPVMVGVFDERLIVYDPLPPSAARGLDAAALHDREAFLLRHANLVFTDWDTRAAGARHRAVRDQPASCPMESPPHRTADGWDALAADTDQLLRDVAGNRRPAPTTRGTVLIPGWLAARQVEGGTLRNG